MSITPPHPPILATSLLHQPAHTTSPIPSPNGIPSIHNNTRSRQGAAHLTGLPHHRAPELLRLRNAAEGHVLDPLLAPRLHLFVRIDRSLDAAGRERVDADAVGAPFGGARARHVCDCGFGLCGGERGGGMRGDWDWACVDEWEQEQKQETRQVGDL
ncbi:hypothetical protein LTR16_005197, partial [Cryomyces antarcticus]